MYQLTAHNHTLTIDQPLIMAIINCTPDSFYSGSRAQNLDQAIYWILEGEAPDQEALKYLTWKKLKG